MGDAAVYLHMQIYTKRGRFCTVQFPVLRESARLQTMQKTMCLDIGLVIMVFSII